MDRQFYSIFFDFDGTIGDTERDIRGAWLSGFAELGLSCARFDSIFRVGPSLPDTAKKLFPEASETQLQEIMAAYKRFYDDADDYSALPYPGMIEAMSELAHDGCKIYIVTNKRYKPALKLVRKFGLTELCSGLFTPDAVSPETPLTKTELVGIALRVSCAPLPSRILMVGDTEIDIRSGRVHGLTTCAVTWGYGNAEKLAAAEPDFLIHAPDELRRLRPLNGTR
ncbi:MAG: HAD hydrolase-like protein [Lentisphaeria bacterium]|nr:HAD hydrolase-like protein [Lentisphaeria bacterium]